MTPEQLSSKIRTIPDFPKQGIVFRDITTLLQDGEAFAAALEAMTAPIRGLEPDVIIGIESRGFIFGAPIAATLGVGFVPVRKLGKLPGETVSIEYDLEYGTNVLQIHRDALRPGDAGLGDAGPLPAVLAGRDQGVDLHHARLRPGARRGDLTGCRSRGVHDRLPGDRIPAHPHTACFLCSTGQ